MAEKVDHTLDCRGLSCPMPILKLAGQMKKIKKGEVLELLGTDPGSKADVPAWCKKTGNEFLGMTEDDGVYKYLIKRKK